MLQKNKMLYGLLILFVSFAMSLNTATAQVTGDDMEKQSQNAFKGVVVDASTGQPVADATVQLQGADKKVTTNENGEFTIENVKATAGERGQTGQSGISLEINKEGYEKLTKTIQPEELQGQQGQQQGQQQPMTFELQPKQGQQEGDY